MFKVTWQDATSNVVTPHGGKWTRPLHALDRHIGCGRINALMHRYVTMRQHKSPAKSVTCRGWIWTPTNTQFLGSKAVSRPNNISISLAVFAQLKCVLNTQTHTDHTTCKICSNRLHLCTAGMQYGIKSRCHTVLFCALALVDPRVGHNVDVLSPFISVLCHSD